MSAILAGRYFTIGRALGRTGIALSRIWVVFILVTIVVGLPELYLFQLLDTQFDRDTLASLLLGSCGIALLDGVAVGWLTAAVLAAEAGQRLSPRASLRRGLPAWLTLVPLIAVGNFTWNVVFVQDSYWRSGIGLVAGMLIMVALWVYAPVVVAERTGIRAGLRRCLALVTGHFWRITVLAVLYLLVYFIVLSVAWSVLPYGLRADFSLGYGGSMSLAGVLNTLINEIATVLAAASYVLLRNDKDGVPVEEVAPVFD